jgi:large repetitive protein
MRLTRVVLVASLFALVVAPVALAIAFTDDSFFVPIGRTGEAYTHRMHIREGGGCPPYTYRILAGNLPPGTSLTADGNQGGTVSGVPTTAGEYSFWLEGRDYPAACGDAIRPAVTTERQFTITILQGVSIQQQTLGVTYLGEAYNAQLTATGGGTQTWSVQSGSPPAGVTLGTDGHLSGTPTATGDFTFVVKVTNGGGSDTETLTLSIVQRLKIAAIKSVAEVGIPFQAASQATGGKPGYVWSLGAGSALPVGLTMDPATGAITGKPTAPGKTEVKLVVTDRLGLTTTLDISFNVVSRILITKRAFPVAKLGKKYSAFFRASGGAVPRTWIMLGGRPGLLPAGMKLNARTGQLSGTPRKAGTYRLRMQVTDKLGARSSAGFVLRVNT